MTLLGFRGVFPGRDLVVLGWVSPSGLVLTRKPSSVFKGACGQSVNTSRVNPLCDSAVSARALLPQAASELPGGVLHFKQQLGTMVQPICASRESTHLLNQPQGGKYLPFHPSWVHSWGLCDKRDDQGVWRNDSGAKKKYCFSRGPEFSFQTPCLMAYSDVLL